MKFHYANELECNIEAEEYSGSDAMIAKVPLSLPYPINFNGYERVSGAFECHGEAYKLVKQNLVNDTLYIVFVKDKKGSAINESLNEFAQRHANEPLSKTASYLIDSLAKQFFSNIIQLQCVDNGWSRMFSFVIFQTKNEDWETSIITPPPQS